MDIFAKRIINSLAEDVLNVYDILIPVQRINDVIEKLGGNIQNTSSFSNGTIEKVGEGFIIFVPPTHDERRKRFAIAHELGHLFLHMGYKINCELWENNFEYRLETAEKEYQANEFAAAFLMPKSKYLTVLKRIKKGNVVDVSKIAEYFNVSVEAADSRGKSLGYLR